MEQEAFANTCSQQVMERRRKTSASFGEDGINESRKNLKAKRDSDPLFSPKFFFMSPMILPYSCIK